MRTPILSRMRIGNKIVAEVPLEDPNYRKWVIVKGAKCLHPRNYLAENPGYLYEVLIIGQRRDHEHEDVPEYHEEQRDVLGEYQVNTEEELFELLEELVPSTDLFDVPWKVYVPY